MTKDIIIDLEQDDKYEIGDINQVKGNTQKLKSKEIQQKKIQKPKRRYRVLIDLDENESDSDQSQISEAVVGLLNKKSCNPDEKFDIGSDYSITTDMKEDSLDDLVNQEVGLDNSKKTTTYQKKRLNKCFVKDYGEV